MFRTKMMQAKLSELQNQIEKTKKELEEIKKLEKPLPEFINTTNALRLNEYYTKEIEKQSKLISNYEKYSKELENLVLTAIDLRSKISKLKLISKKTKTKRKRKVKAKKRPSRSKLTSRKKRKKIKHKTRKKRH